MNSKALTQMLVAEQERARAEKAERDGDPESLRVRFAVIRREPIRPKWRKLREELCARKREAVLAAKAASEAVSRVKSANRKFWATVEAEMGTDGYLRWEEPRDGGPGEVLELVPLVLDEPLPPGSELDDRQEGVLNPKAVWDDDDGEDA